MDLFHLIFRFLIRNCLRNRSPFRDGTGRLLLPEPLPGHLVNEVVAADPGPGPIQAGAPV